MALSTMTGTVHQADIDDSLYSRQRYMLGDSAMKRMTTSSVLLCGLGGLGIEIAKNIVLAGVKKLSVKDEQICSVEDLGDQFFIRQEDITQQVSRSVASAPRLAELNPYVTVNVVTGDVRNEVSSETDYQCVILTEASLDSQLEVNEFCRNRTPPIKFISGDVHGLLASAFCDFGPEFEVADKYGEEAKQFFIGNISQSNPGVVTTFDKQLHGLESGDCVRFKEIVGMSELNKETHTITVTSPYSFTICDTSHGYSPYLHGGIANQILVPHTLQFNSLNNELNSPSLIVPDLCKYEAPVNLHVAYLVCKKLESMNKSNVDVSEFLKCAQEINAVQPNQINLDEKLLTYIASTYTGCLPPLCATLGGFLAQECIKAVTAKFMPLQQWLHLDVTELLTGTDIDNVQNFETRQDRYDRIRRCIGETTLNQLSQLQLFLVGSGAIGCEMLKNLALLGVGTSSNGKITVTDHDLIEKSNLNRQFLFRPHHIRQSKSVTAAASAREINPDMNIDAHQNKVCPDTQATIYDDKFFESQNICVNALDNIEARRYMDSRCVANETALIETGTMGSKGHVQVIAPHMTETYTAQNDPVDADIPYCTLKSFPATIDHCIQWARDKFESSFVQKPNLFNKFWSLNTDHNLVIQNLRQDKNVDCACQVGQILRNKPSDWTTCLQLARLKFEKYFCNRAKQLLHAFPLESKLSDNITLFWQSPKRPPKPIIFDITNELHKAFLIATARMYADRDGILYSLQEMDAECISQALVDLEVPSFTPLNKSIETSSEAKKPEPIEITGDELTQAADIIESFLSTQRVGSMTPLEFEKDNDSNGHIDFITSAANLRASMYGIDVSDRLTIKRIAGRIIPAIATTTATIAGLATIEMIKVISGKKLEDLRNCFLNLALPAIILSEPGTAKEEKINDNITFTVWDKWHVYGNPLYTLDMFVKHFNDKYGLEVSMVIQGVKPIYVPALPLHSKRLIQTMLNLLRPSSEQLYSDLVISFASSLDTESLDDLGAPPVRYHFGR